MNGYEWLDEKVDARNAIMGILAKYKQRCEWFHRERLRKTAREGIEGHMRGERSLVIDLQEYVFNQGMEFTVEPTSASGEVDLVLRDADGSRIILDAKYIDTGSAPGEFKRKFATGFHQVSRYCHDFDEMVGYLVVYIVDKKIPRPVLESSDGHQYLEVNGKQIYYIPVYIAESPSASRAGTAEVVVIERDEMIREYTDLSEGTSA